MASMLVHELRVLRAAFRKVTEPGAVKRALAEQPGGLFIVCSALSTIGIGYFAYKGLVADNPGRHFEKKPFFFGYQTVFDGGRERPRVEAFKYRHVHPNDVHRTFALLTQAELAMESRRDGGQEAQPQGE